MREKIEKLLNYLNEKVLENLDHLDSEIKTSKGSERKTHEISEEKKLKYYKEIYNSVLKIMTVQSEISIEIMNDILSEYKESINELRI